MNKLAIVTGASGGIGSALSSVLATHGFDLLLVDKRANQLAELEHELSVNFPNVEIDAIAKNLTDPGAVAEIEAYTDSRNKVPEILINNAGFGTIGMFTEIKWDLEEQMLRLHVITLTNLTKIYLRKMVAKGRGRIMNVASVAGFHPSPLMAVYNASKAYIISFSEAVANEVKDKGVTITVLCPGLTRTGFQKVVGGGEPDFTKSPLLSRDNNDPN